MFTCDLSTLFPFCVIRRTRAHQFAILRFVQQGIFDSTNVKLSDEVRARSSLYPWCPSIRSWLLFLILFRGAQKIARKQTTRHSFWCTTHALNKSSASPSSEHRQTSDVRPNLSRKLLTEFSQNIPIEANETQTRSPSWHSTYKHFELVFPDEIRYLLLLYFKKFTFCFSSFLLQFFGWLIGFVFMSDWPVSIYILHTSFYCFP